MKNLIIRLIPLLVLVFVLLDKNNVVTATNTRQLEGYIEAPNYVECGWTKLQDGTWQAPAKTE